MIKLPLCKSTIAALLCATSLVTFAQEGDKTVAFKLESGDYVGMMPGGKLAVTGKTLGGRQIFQLADANGGELADDDSIKIKETASGPNKPTFWQENSEGKLARVPKADDACVFKVKKSDKTIKLQTASGKYVVVADKALGTTDAEDKATAFELVENPKIEEKPASSGAAAASPSPSASAAP